MKTYEAMLPSGRERTMAVSLSKAKANFRYRLMRSGMTKYQAGKYDLSDTHEVNPRQ